MKCIYWPRKPLLWGIAAAVWRVLRKRFKESLVVH